MNLKSTNLESHLFKKVFDSVLDRDVSITEVANNQIISIMSRFILVCMCVCACIHVQSCMYVYMCVSVIVYFDVYM